MDALGVLMIGVGAWLLYEAVKSKDPTPIANAKGALGSVSGSKTPAGG